VDGTCVLERYCEWLLLMIDDRWWLMAKLRYCEWLLLMIDEKKEGQTLMVVVGQTGQTASKKSEKKARRPNCFKVKKAKLLQSLRSLN
jgi:hypothetical protein